MIHISKNSTELAEELAQHIVSLIVQKLKHRPVFSIALSGGNTPKSLYKLLAGEPYFSQIDWKKIILFWGDERFVPFDSKENNAGMAYDEWLSHVPVPAENVHRIDTISSPAESAEEYEIMLRSYFKEPQTLDLTLLGMGDDGHTLSIFPAEKYDDTKWVNALYSSSKNQWRITLTPAFVNRSAEIIFMISGKGKAEVLKYIVDGNGNKTFPAQLIKPVNGNLNWYIDTEAAALLK
ncbi:MAG: 6-phosphogluconolactonase [Ginsengibacter sp.]